MRSLRILLAAAEPPLPEGSAVGRWNYSLIRGLVNRGHRVTAFVACHNSEDELETGRIFPKTQYDVRCYAVPRRVGIGAKVDTLRRPHSYSFSRKFSDELHAECKLDHDVLHLEGTWSGWLGLDCNTSKAILNVHNLFSTDWVLRRSLGWNERFRRSLCVRAERKLIRSYPTLLAVSPQLAEEVRLIAPRSKVHFVPLTLDVDNYSYIPKHRRPAEPVIGLIGSMNWHPSRSAAERLLTRLWPAIRRKFANARVEITGRDARRVLHQFVNVPGVEIRENVAVTKPYFENAAILLYAPETGSGVKVKVLEAFAYGVPVVTTPDGVEGIEAKDGVHAGIHGTDEGLIERSIQLLSNPALQETQRIAARSLLETNHSPDSVLQRLEECYSI
jgi:glycosyltransferase involved in cell wall biosynthesis